MNPGLSRQMVDLEHAKLPIVRPCASDNDECSRSTSGIIQAQIDSFFSQALPIKCRDFHPG